MSLRDAAAALGVSKSELHRWQKLAAIPEADFDALLVENRGHKSMRTARGLLDQYKSTNKLSPRRDRDICPCCGRPLVRRRAQR